MKKQYLRSHTPEPVLFTILDKAVPYIMAILAVILIVRHIVLIDFW